MKRRARSKLWTQQRTQISFGNKSRRNCDSILWRHECKSQVTTSSILHSIFPSRNRESRVSQNISLSLSPALLDLWIVWTTHPTNNKKEDGETTPWQEEHTTDYTHKETASAFFNPVCLQLYHSCSSSDRLGSWENWRDKIEVASKAPFSWELRLPPISPFRICVLLPISSSVFMQHRHKESISFF